MVTKFKRNVKHSDATYVQPDYFFECPGCGSYHGVWTTQKNSLGAMWGFNQNLEKPTLTPSVLITIERGERVPKVVCHSFIKDGNIEFLNDCTHHLAGKTVELPNI